MKLQEFKDGDCTFGARVRKMAGTRSFCIPTSAGTERVKDTQILLDTVVHLHEFGKRGWVIGLLK